MAGKNDPQPVVLDAAPAAGAVWFGAGVRAMIIVLDDGRKQRLELPAPAAPGDSPGLSQTQRRIMNIHRSSPKPLTRQAVANKMGLKSTSGDFGVEYTDLVEQGHLHPRGPEYADDVAKFGADEG